MGNFDSADARKIYGESTEVTGKALMEVRLCAFLVDHIIITFILTVPAMLILFRSLELSFGRIITALPIVLLVGFFVYGLKDIVKGQSLGKFMFGIAVRSRANLSQTPAAGKLFLRNIGTFLWPVDFLFLLCSKKKLRIGDSIAGTDVYRLSRKPKVPLIIVAAVLAFILFFGSLFVGVIAIIRNHPSYQEALNYIEAHPRIAALVGDVEGFGFFPNGSVSTTGGHGQAEFAIRVIGSNNMVNVRIRLEREPLGDWEVVDFCYR